jgi:hypothetical protein
MKNISSGWICLTAAMVLLMGCASLKQHPVPPDYLKITANALPPRAELIEPVRLAALGEQTFFANGAEAFSISGDDAAQKLMAARSAARRQALRTLASQMLQIPVGEGRTLGQFLDDNPTQAAALEDLIEIRSQVTFPKVVGNQAVAEASLKGAEIIALFSGKDRLVPLSELPPETRDAIKKSTYDAALQLARDRMHIGVLEIHLKNGQRLGDELARKPAAMSALHEMIDTTEPDEVNYSEDGSCELVFFLDQNKARALAEKRNGWFF